MPSIAQLKALGLNISPNPLSLEEGSLIEANNVIIRRDGVVESRRGFKIYGNSLQLSNDRAKQLLTYKGRILRHYSNLLESDNGSGTFTAFSGNYSEVQTGLRIRGLETSGNFYFTTNNGIKKISSFDAASLSTATITQAGGVKGIDFKAEPKITLGDQSGFFGADSALAYRIVWGTKDSNTNLVLGSPSQRVEVYNSLQTLLIRDFLNLLGALDDIDQSGSLITDGNYVNTLKLPIDSAASSLYDNLILLVTKIDEDILFANDTGTGVPLTIGSGAIAGTTCTLTLSVGNPTTYVQIGDKIFLKNFATGTGSINGIQTITNVTAATVEFTTTATGAVNIVGASFESHTYRNITQPALPGTPTTHFELTALQTYISNIMLELQGELSGVISVPLKTAYIDPLLVTTGGTVLLTINIPQDISSDYFYQVYRSSVTLSEGGTILTSDVFPNDELQQVYEAYPSAAELTAGEIVIEDVTPDEFRGANLYTNAASGEGILQSNDVPPLAKDINKFKEYTFYSNTKTKHRKLISLLGVSNMIDDFNLSIIPTLTIANSSYFNTYRFVVGLPQITSITCVADVTNSLDGKYFLINSAENKTEYYVWFKTSIGVDPAIANKTGIQVNIPTNETAPNIAIKVRDELSVYVSDFTASASGSIVTVTNVNVGYTNYSIDFNTGFTIPTPTQVGTGEKCTRELSTFTCVADVAGSLAGTYFTVTNGFNQTKYYVWYSVSGVGVDPAIVGATGLKVNIVTNDTASSVSTATSLVINTSLPTHFIANSNAASLAIENYKFGPANNATIGTSGFSLSINTKGALDVLMSSVVSPSKAVDETSRSLIRVINNNLTEQIYGFYLSGVQEVPGKMNLEARDLEDVEFFLTVNNSTTGSAFNPILTPDSIITAVTTGTPSTMLITTSTSHGLITDDQVELSNTNSFPVIDGIWTVSVVNSTQFRITTNIYTAGTTGSTSKLSLTESSENEAKRNRVYYSKLQQPEAVPILNYFDVGSEDKEILRIHPLRDSLFVFKEDGLYRISGEIAPFSVSLFDSSCIVIAPDSLSVANNQLYTWTTQGIVTVTEAGVSIISRPIDTDILRLSSADYSNFKTMTWGVGYESDNSYIVFTNTETIDTIPTIAYRYSNLTNSWTAFDKTNTCGIVNNTDDKLYLGAGDISYLEQERKSFNRYDYADREYNNTLSENHYFDNIIQLVTVENISPGDVVLQEQTLSVFKYNELLHKLDLDINLLDTNYFTSLQASGGDNLQLALDSLINKIAIDAGRLAIVGAHPALSYTSLTPTASNFTSLMNNYNSLINLLNSDVGVGFNNYSLITETTNQEAVILTIDRITKKVTLNTTLEYIVGPLIIFKSISSYFTYGPSTFGDPLSLKQIRECTLMFVNKAFTFANLSFATDLLPDESPVTFYGDGSGIFGHQSFGSNYFGGNSNSAPFRTYIPRDKQRCRYIVCKFSHDVAREKYSVLGLTLTSESTSTRAYR